MNRLIQLSGCIALAVALAAAQYGHIWPARGLLLVGALAVTYGAYRAGLDHK